WGLALIAALVLKELPFLLWNVAAQLRRAGQADEITRQLQLAATLGYLPRSAWWRVLWPQLLPRLSLPLLAVWAYALTVVDMAIVLGPTRPPTLAMLAWRWLLDANVATNRAGAAAAVLLALCVAAGAWTAVTTARALHPLLMRRWTRGDRPAAPARRPLPAAPLLCSAYALVVLALVFVSLAGVWRFPDLLPAQWDTRNWRTALDSASTLGTTTLLALLSAATGVALAIGWMETTPPHWDTRAAPFVFAPMLVPGVLLAGGLYQLSLSLRLDGSWVGLWLAHSLAAAPYALVSLAPAYRALDPRYEQTAQALGRGRLATLCRVKWPMLLAPIAAAFAVGFAVSVAQFLSTQFVGAGRYATLTTEALTLASGGQRGLGGAFALLQALLPATVFAIAWWLGHVQASRLGAPGAAAVGA
ncbi:MAG TPA: ABC transporter permease subunit, partial [Albitalea sp.]|nr:ABC transporter permease subunit [Albitalea sp.]